MKKRKENNNDYKKSTLVVCPKCKAENVITLDNCVECGTELPGSKSCPRCAKINKKGVKNCISCGYQFDKKNKKNVIVSLGLSFVVILILFILTITGNRDVVNNFNQIFRVILAILIFLIIISIFTYGRKDKVDYNKMYNNSNDEFKSFRRYSYWVAMVGVTIVYLLVMYFCFVK